MNNYIRYGLLIWMCCMCVLDMRADAVNDEVMHFINKENGLAGESVSRIITDHNGQVWIATSDGVNRYNGRQIVTFNIPRADVDRNYTYNIMEGSNHSIYAATKEGLFELKTDARNFKRILPQIERVECLLEYQGNLYMGNRNGLHIYDGRHLKTVSVGASPLGIENSVRDIKADGHGNVWFISRYALNQYNPRTGRVKSTMLTDRMPDGTAFGHLALCRGKFYIGTKNNGLFAYDIHTRKIVHVDGVGNVVTSLNVTRAGDLCVSTDGSGAYLLDTRTNTIREQFNTLGTSRNHLPTNATYCYYKDANGVDWFGFYRYGMAYTYHSAPLFNIYRFRDFSTAGIDVRSFCIRGSEVLIGSSTGLYYVDETRGIIRHYSPEQLGGVHIITCITFFNGCYYVASYDGGVRVFNPQTAALTMVSGDPLLDNTTVNVLTVSPDGRLWIGSGEGIFILDKGGHLTRYTENNARIMGGVISAITFSANGNGWIGGAQGLSLYTSASGQFENSNFPKGFFNRERVSEICVGHQGTVYFNMMSHINYSSPSMNRFGSITLPQGLLDETCYSFLDDLRGHFYVATENGLFRMNYDMHDLLHFGYGEGLCCQLINGSIHIDSKGTLWLGTSNGLMSIRPDRLEQWQKSTRFKVLLYDIRKSGELIPYTEETQVNEKRRIMLKWNLTSGALSVKPVLEDFARPYGRLYEYRLDGDKNWHLIQDGSEIALRNMLPGNHEMTVRLTGAPGTSVVYNIVVVPSWLAIFELIFIVVAITLFLLWRRYRRNTNDLLSERNEIEEALIEVETEQHREELPKYNRVKIDEEECAGIVAQMKAYIDEKKIYTNPELKMSDLADTLHLSASKLSLVFSLYLKENYYEFINAYRLREFKRLIDDGEYRRYTLTALSEKCGFKKSSFFSTFRRVEGMTPTEYLKKRNIKM